MDLETPHEVVGGGEFRDVWNDNVEKSVWVCGSGVCWGREHIAKGSRHGGDQRKLREKTI